MSPEPVDIQELLTFAPPLGVLSIYVDLDPGDRGEAWRIELRNGLADARDSGSGDDHESRMAIEATVDRIRERFDNEVDYEGGRSRIGFVEVARKPGRETWHSLQPDPPWRGVLWNSRPFLLPLVEMLDEGRTRGVAVLSSERVRVLEWSLHRTEQIEDFRPTHESPGHERTAPDAERQLGQPLEVHVVRFLKEVAGDLLYIAAAREWPELLMIGPHPLAEELAKVLPSGPPAESIDTHDLIAEPTVAIGERVAECVTRLNRERELDLVERVESAALSSAGRGALGPQECLETLIEGRVEHLLLDGQRDYRSRPLEQDLAYEAEEHGDLPLVERLVELAYATSARVTPVEGQAAEQLERHGGAAALLRF